MKKHKSFDIWGRHQPTKSLLYLAANSNDRISAKNKEEYLKCLNSEGQERNWAPSLSENTSPSSSSFVEKVGRKGSLYAVTTLQNQNVSKINTFKVTKPSNLLEKSLCDI